MKKQVRVITIALLFIASFFAASCATVKKVPAESSRAGVQTTVSSIDKYGNCALGITQDEFTAAGFEPGDIVSVKAGAFAFDASVCTNYSDVDNGKYLVRLSKGTVSFTDEDFIKRLHDALVFIGKKKSASYLVHCNEGKDRAGSIVCMSSAPQNAGVCGLYYGYADDTAQST